MTVANPSLTSGRFDTSKFNKAPHGERGVEQESDIREIAELKRGIAWLEREMPALQTFARVITGQPHLKVMVGPVSCTDGRDHIYVAPQRVPEGVDPGPRHMAHLYHEIAHALESQVFEPAESRKPEDSLKFKAIAAYGEPAEHIWNGLEDGRVEERLYRTMPGARKHLIVDVESASPNVAEQIKQKARVFAFEHLLKTADKDTVRQKAEELKSRQASMTPEAFIDEVYTIWEEFVGSGDTEAADKVETQVMNDMGLIMASYLYSAGYEPQARLFGDGVNAALDDPQMQQIMDSVHNADSSLVIFHEQTPAFLNRAKELGFFLDYDPRGLNPYTNQPQVIDWNDLTDDEKEALREQIKKQKGQKKPDGAEEALIKNLPKDLLDEMQKNESQEQDANQQEGESGEGSCDQDGGEESGGQQSDRSDGSDSSGASGDGDSGDLSDRASGDSDGTEHQGADGDASDTGSVGDGDEESGAESEAEAGDGSSAVGEDESAEDAGASEAMDRDAEASPSVEGEGAKVSENQSHGQGQAGRRDETDFEKADSAEYESAPELDDEDSDSAFDDDEDGDGEYGAGDEDDAEDDAEDATRSEDGEGHGDVEGDELDDDTEFDEEEIEAAAKELHSKNESARVERVKNFKSEFEKIEDSVRPPHVEYASKDEARKLETYDSNAIKAKTAMNMEVGEISGAPESKFLFKESKIEAPTYGQAPTLDEYNDVIAGELNRLRAIFKQNEKAAFSGRFEIGSHINGASLPGLVMGEHLKPFDKRIKPRKQSYAVTLLVDQSGSMTGNKIALARIALCLQAHLLDQLRIPFEILGFSTMNAAGVGYWDSVNFAVQHDVFKSFDQPWNSQQRAKVLAIRTNQTNLDGLALAWAWNRLKLRRENTKILMTYSDGQPNPDTDNQIKIMRHVLHQMQIAGAIPIAVGIQSYATKDLYPHSIFCDDVRTLPRMVTRELETQLKKRRV